MENEVFTRVMELYIDDVFRVAYSICQNISDSEDISQTVFEKLYVSETAFVDDEHIKKWLIAVTVNESRSLMRTVWKRKVDYYLPEGGVKRDSHENDERLAKALIQLKDKYRILIHLYYYEDMDVREIAETLKMSESSVKTGLHRARKQLKKKMESEE